MTEKPEGVRSDSQSSEAGDIARLLKDGEKERAVEILKQKTGPKGRAGRKFFHELIPHEEVHRWGILVVLIVGCIVAVLLAALVYMRY